MALADKDPIRDLNDRAIRDSLRFGEHLRGLLGRLVPDIVDGFQFDQLRPLDRDFPVEDWRRREADLPVEIPFRVGQELIKALVVLLLEHQSDTDPMMPLRLLYFAVVYWDQQWRAWEELPSPKPPFRLNPVLPVVVYTGTTPWGSNRTLADLLGEPQALHVYAPTWQPLFWNLAEQSPQELLSSDNSWLQMMAVLRVEKEDAATFKEVFTDAVHQVKKIKGAEHVRWQSLMQILLTWVYWRRPEVERPALLAAAAQAQASVKRKEEIQQMSNKLGPSFVDLAMAAAKDLAMDAAKDRFMKEGMEKGHAIGQLQALRETLRAVLQAKFGRLPRKLQKQIDAANDAAQLLQAILRVSHCQALADFQL